MMLKEEVSSNVIIVEGLALLKQDSAVILDILTKKFNISRENMKYYLHMIVSNVPKSTNGKGIWKATSKQNMKDCLSIVSIATNLLELHMICACMFHGNILLLSLLNAIYVQKFVAPKLD